MAIKTSLSPGIFPGGDTSGKSQERRDTKESCKKDSRKKKPGELSRINFGLPNGKGINQ